MENLGSLNAKVRRRLRVVLSAVALKVRGHNGSWNDGFRSYDSCDDRPLARTGTDCDFGCLGSVPEDVKMEVRNNW